MAMLNLEEIEKIWHGLHLPYINLFSWLENKGSKPKISIYDIFHPMMLAHPLVDRKRFIKQQIQKISLLNINGTE